MINSQIKLAFKSLKKHKVPSFINFFGFFLGITSALVLLGILQHDWKFDTYHTKADRIYRMSIKLNLQGGERHFASTSAISAENLAEAIPEVKSVIRQRYMPATLRFNEKIFSDEPILYVDRTYFDAFTVDLIEGVLPEHSSQVLISERTKERIFGNENAIGETFSVESQAVNGQWIVSGVYSSYPTNTSFRPSFITSFEQIEQIHNRNHGAIVPYLNTFLLTHQTVSNELLQEKITAYLSEQLDDNLAQVLDHRLEPYLMVHYADGLEFDFPQKHKSQTLWVLAILASFILLSTLVNFFNMQTALAVQRAKELSIKIALGQSFKNKLIQICSESFLLLAPSFLLAGISVYFLLQFLESYTELSLQTGMLSRNKLPVLIGLTFIVFWLISSAISLSVLRARNKLFSYTKRSRSTDLLKRLLIGFQFSLACFFILNALVINKQLNYLNSTELGFQKEGVINVSLVGFNNYEQAQTLKNNILSIPGITSISASQTPIFGNQGKGNFAYQRDTTSESHLMNMNFIDEDFLETNGLNLIAGENLIRGERGMIINEQTAELLGFVPYINAVGKQIVYAGRDTSLTYTVSGVVSNYHYSTMHQSIEPIVLFPNDQSGYYNLSVRMYENTMEGVISALEDKWQELYPGFQFNYNVMEESLDLAYRDDFQKGTFYQYSTLLLVAIAALGIFGLTYYYADQKRKEIGVRKAIGARIYHILKQLALPMLLVCVIALVIAIPLGYQLASEWLNEYEYAIQIGWTEFLMTFLLMMVLSSTALLYPGIKATKINPVDALREE